MARLDEIAEGLAAVLQMTPEPDPLGVDFVGQSPAEVTFLIRAIVDACQRCGAPLSLIRVGRDCGSNAARVLGPRPLQYEGVRVELTTDLIGRIELHRFPGD